MHTSAQWLASLALILVTGTATLGQETKGDERPAVVAKTSEEMERKPKPKLSRVMDEEDNTRDVNLSLGASQLGKRFLLDQKEIWTSPARLRWTDANWLLPLSGVTTGLLVTDVHSSRHISQNPATMSHYSNLS